MLDEQRIRHVNWCLIYNHGKIIKISKRWCVCASYKSTPKWRIRSPTDGPFDKHFWTSLKRSISATELYKLQSPTAKRTFAVTNLCKDALEATKSITDFQERTSNYVFSLERKYKTVFFLLVLRLADHGISFKVSVQGCNQRTWLKILSCTQLYI